MSDTYKTIIRDCWEAADRGDMEAVVKDVTPGFQFYLGGEAPMDAETYKNFGGAFYQAFPDHKHVIEEQVAEGDRVVSRITIHGTHLGEFQGLAPTNKEVAIRGLVLDRFTDEGLAERRAMLDVMGLMQQLGALPSDAG